MHDQLIYLLPSQTQSQPSTIGVEGLIVVAQPWPYSPAPGSLEYPTSRLDPPGLAIVEEVTQMELTCLIF